MQESTSREKVLKAIRAALINPMDPPFVDENYSGIIYAHSESEYDEVIFAEALAKVGGQFVFNADLEEFVVNFKKFVEGKEETILHCYDSRIQKILNDSGIFCFNAREEFKDCEMGITSCEFLIARLGSIMVSSKLESGRRSFFWPPVHIVMAWKDQLVYDLKDALGALKMKYKDSGLPSMINVITGPSRTADIEKTLVMGAHGPAKLIVFFIDQPYPVDVTMGQI